MRDLTQGNIYKNFIIFSLPIMITGFLMQLFNIIDTVIAGKMLGGNSIAAMQATAPLVTLISCAVSGYTLGFSIYIARLFGSKKFDDIKSSFYSFIGITSVFLFTILSILVIFRGTVADILKIDFSIRSDAIGYFSIYCISIIFMMFRYACTYLLHALGNTVYPFVVSVISSIVHIVCSLFIIIILNYSSVHALAVANVFSTMFASILLFMKVKECFKLLNITAHYKFETASLRPILKYALSPMLQQIIMYTSDVMLSPLINSLNSIQLSAYSVSNRLKVISEQTFCSSSKALSNYSAQCIGSHQQNIIKKGVYASALQGTITLLPIISVCFVFAKSVAGLFFDSQQNESINYVVTYIKCYMPFMFFNVINNLFHSFFRGINARKYLLIITTCGSFLKYLFAIPLLGKYQIHGLWIAIVMAWIFEAGICIILYYSGVWKKYIKR